MKQRRRGRRGRLAIGRADQTGYSSSNNWIGCWLVSSGHGHREVCCFAAITSSQAVFIGSHFELPVSSMHSNGRGESEHIHTVDVLLIVCGNIRTAVSARPDEDSARLTASGQWAAQAANPAPSPARPAYELRVAIKLYTDYLRLRTRGKLLCRLLFLISS
eukprot:1572271-Pleurochrysis_carterae.AAC.4